MTQNSLMILPEYSLETAKIKSETQQNSHPASNLQAVLPMPKNNILNRDKAEFRQAKLK